MLCTEGIWGPTGTPSCVSCMNRDGDCDGGYAGDCDGGCGGHTTHDNNTSACAANRFDPTIEFNLTFALTT